MPRSEAHDTVFENTVTVIESNASIPDQPPTTTFRETFASRTSRMETPDMYPGRRTMSLPSTRRSCAMYALIPLPAPRKVLSETVTRPDPRIPTPTEPEVISSRVMSTSAADSTAIPSQTSWRTASETVTFDRPYRKIPAPSDAPSPSTRTSRTRTKEDVPTIRIPTSTPDAMSQPEITYGS